MIKIGELSKKCGLSIRTLHHYDDYGLLRPSNRSNSGYRLYSEKDIAQLQHILTLKQLGFSLKNIMDILVNESSNLSLSIDQHILQIENYMKSQTKLLSQLKRLQSKFSKGDMISINDYLQTMELMTMFDKYFSKSELDDFTQLRNTMGEDDFSQIQNESWPNLLKKVQLAVEQKINPESVQAGQLAKEWMDLVKMFTQGDTEIEQKVSKMYKDEEGLRQKMGLTPEITSFINQAWSCFNTQ